MNKLFSFTVFLFIFVHSFSVYGKKIKLPPLILIQINYLLDVSVSKFYKETLDSGLQFKGDSLPEMKKLTELLLIASKSLPLETAIHFKKIFQALNVQLSLLLKTSKSLYVKQVWKSLFVISRSFKTKTYLYGFCAKDKSMWLQKAKSKPVNPIGMRSCVNAI